MTCPYCSSLEDLFDYSMPINGLVNAYLTIELSILGHSMIVSADSYDEGGFSTGFKINYCPMCGRKLSDE